MRLTSLASNIQGISTPFGKYGGTLIYEYNDPEDFANNIIKFYSDKELQIKLSKKSYELCSNISGKNKFSKNWKAIEESFMNKRLLYFNLAVDEKDTSLGLQSTG